MNNIKLSIIIPTFFEEKMLGNLLSIFTAELKSKYNFEVIVSDGGSTDDTLNLANQYADKIIEHSSSAPRQNISQGRNNGAKIATGDIFIFLNADCMPNDIELFFTSIINWATQQNKTTDAIACKVKSFPNDEKLKDKIFYLVHNNYVHLLNNIGIGMGRGECQIVRRKMFEKVAGYNETIVAGEDFDLYRRIVKNKGKILFSKKILINESARRFRKYGYIKTLWYWTLNSITVIFLNKSASKEWAPIR